MSVYMNSIYMPMSSEKEAAFFYKQRQQKRKSIKPTVSQDVEKIFKVDNLAAVVDRMRRKNGKAPGPDGIRFDDLGRRELYNVLRLIREAVVSGAYRPGLALEVRIPKSGNRGHRILTLRNLPDRIVAKALNEAMSPFWEKHYLNGSHGFRTRRSNWTLLANLEQAIVSQNRWVLVSDDVKNAFPSLNIDLIIEDHRRLLGDNPRLLNLIEVILRGDKQDHRIGLDQGSPYMPTALNVHLTSVFDAHAHDLGVNPGQATPWFRYADNIVVPCQDVTEGEILLRRMNPQLATVGLELKGENDGRPVDLRQAGQQVHLLGFILYKHGNDLGITIGAEAWKELEKGLIRAHESKRPFEAAKTTIDGWIASHGPAFRKRQNRAVSRICDLASRYGFRELASEETYLKRCHSAYCRWLGLKAKQRHVHT